MSDYFDGYDAGLDAGWGAGKAKAYREVLHRLANPSHSASCGCAPCLVIRACRGEIDLARAMNSHLRHRRVRRTCGDRRRVLPLRPPPYAPYAPLGRPEGVKTTNGPKISQIVATHAWANPSGPSHKLAAIWRPHAHQRPRCPIPGRMPPARARPFHHRAVKGGEKTCHWGGVKLYHLGGA